MNIKCDISIEYDDVKKAEKILKSIEVDNINFAESQINGKRLETHIESNTISSLLHTLDDYLACVSVADKVIKDK
jgi:hypothetical protein